MNAIQCNVHKDRCNDSLEHGDDRRLLADLLQRIDAELVAHGKGDEAQRDLRDDLKFLDVFQRGEAEAVKTQTAEAKGADQDTADKVGGDRRHVEFLGQSGHHKTRKQSNGKR